MNLYTIKELKKRLINSFYIGDIVLTNKDMLPLTKFNNIDNLKNNSIKINLYFLKNQKIYPKEFIKVKITYLISDKLYKQYSECIINKDNTINFPNITGINSTCYYFTLHIINKNLKNIYLENYILINQYITNDNKFPIREVYLGKGVLELSKN